MNRFISVVERSISEECTTSVKLDLESAVFWCGALYFNGRAIDQWRVHDKRRIRPWKRFFLMWSAWFSIVERSISKGCAITVKTDVESVFFWCGAFDFNGRALDAHQSIQALTKLKKNSAIYWCEALFFDVWIHVQCKLQFVFRFSVEQHIILMEINRRQLGLKKFVQKVSPTSFFCPTIQNFKIKTEFSRHRTVCHWSLGYTTVFG
jgi:hypothetical protein